MTTANLLTSLLPAPYDASDAEVQAWNTAVAAQIDAVTDCADRITAGGFLLSADLIDDWERQQGLQASTHTDAQRIAKVKASLVRTGGLSEPYFKMLAAALGYEIEFVDIIPLPTPLGRMRVGQRFQDVGRWWCVGVRIMSTATRPATCIDPCDSPLVISPIATRDELAALLIDLKPAHVYLRVVEDAPE